MTPIIGHHYRLTANPYPGRVYRCDSIVDGQVNLTIIKRDESEREPGVSIADYRFAALAEETDPP
jgi:hypothetical protein